MANATPCTTGAAEIVTYELASCNEAPRPLPAEKKS